METSLLTISNLKDRLKGHVLTITNIPKEPEYDISTVKLNSMNLDHLHTTNMKISQHPKLNLEKNVDYKQNNDELETTSGDRSRRESAWAGRATPPAASFPMQNSSHVKFEPPNVPVIFVLGGPGSGKVTHCDNLMQERRGVVHINMTDLLQQYAIGNGTAFMTLVAAIGD
ncbi:uncharacterized protein LOC114363277 [Ostrinia furnacalis]|uniref:uncharacterized protein LOC114363277 n=1 Tax=Ostrinia furnacalis TaxID=93504 RepID=UPI00103E2113|nr:uncharacterized protein LOC114363277 [Ostrinia furnacalis]